MKLLEEELKVGLAGVALPSHIPPHLLDFTWQTCPGGLSSVFITRMAFGWVTQLSVAVFYILIACFKLDHLTTVISCTHSYKKAKGCPPPHERGSVAIG